MLHSIDEITLTVLEYRSITQRFFQYFVETVYSVKYSEFCHNQYSYYSGMLFYRFSKKIYSKNRGGIINDHFGV